MSISEHDVARIAKLANIALDGDDASHVRQELNEMLALIAQLQSVDAKGVEPLAHPLSVIEDVQLRLREDVAEVGAEVGSAVSAAVPTDASAALSRREHLMRNAPARHDGLFLVPAVIE